MSPSALPKAQVFRNYVRSAFRTAAGAFEDDPSAQNWVDLKVAMWAWQHVHQMKDELPDAAHTHLSEIAARAKGDDNFEEQP